MHVHPWTWGVTVAVLLAVIAVDFFIVTRRPHEPSMTESGIWVSIYVGLAIVFGGVLWYFAGAGAGLDFLTGWIVEYSMSVDNLFVFILLFSSFAVPPEHRQRVLLVGIALSLLFRGLFIALGAAVVSAFAAVFFLFGAFLLYTAWNLVRGGDESEDYQENMAVRLVRRVLPASPDYDGAKLTTRVGGKLMVTPMLLVMAALGLTDVMFALDSIPAIFGITDEPYIVFTANAFALMGLRQLYFLLGGLLDHLVYLNKGLAVILAFIGVKLILHALHETTDLPVPEIPTWVSLVVIVLTLVITTVASLVANRRSSVQDDGAGSANGADTRAPGADGPEGDASGSGAGAEGAEPSASDDAPGPRTGSSADQPFRREPGRETG